MLALWIVLAHLVGDYVIQSHWMATEKTKHWLPAIVHGVTYTLPYALITQSPLALVVIGGTHIIIDRFRLARHVAWLKNQLGPKRSRPRWADAKATGYPSETPAWLSVWLMIITDNTIHLLINTAAILWM
ncbi:hypothetical protein QFZ79_003962 [Arthrobacter sp. V4I6]|jgi:hypothetical protein|uniref:DUF3307 domain-containing protein n=1 Tax=unclassified Arthrobacter TaxID=235627 RepID=UPI00277DAB76|nr:MULTISPECIES: DUF3307 domain-containing protein [unclassified Arthrobacter]MDQ0821586.1 hypothetical protein [Arthrobacter sp. V1I7]MDQ0855851.1 hypothetical protein [Arthrobacter sp. V4I6]